MSSAVDCTTEPSSTPTTSQRLFGGFLWIATAAASFFVLWWGFDAGDVTSTEASYLLAHPSVVGDGGSLPWYGAMCERLGGSVGVAAPEVGRFLSALSLTILALLIVGVIARRLGLEAALVALVAAACSLPAFLLSTQATPDALIALVIVGALRLLPVVGGPGRILQTSFGIALVCLGAAMLWWGRGQQLVTNPSDAILQPLMSLLLCLPWLLALVPLGTASFWKSNTPGEQREIIHGCALVGTGLVLSACLRQAHLAGSLLTAVGVASLVSVCWQRWREGTLGENASRLQRGVITFLSIGVPVIAVIAAAIRIGLIYNFMERTQAVLVAGLAALTFRAFLGTKQFRQVQFAPIVAIFAMTKIVYVNAYLPERDQWFSPKPYAHAVGRLLPGDATLATDLPVDDSYRYYLERPVVAFTGDSAESTSVPPTHALLVDTQYQNLSEQQRERWQFVRYLYDRGTRRLVLLRETTDVAATSLERGTETR
ncbi:hypothetical protein Pan216_25430 [Planctomycetes bacterium Pan216]|uniref:Uncharacterized protein n=1 Tax=Kolteria novifilia TaxID=2527975 RepID=A0A518B3W0_9BACT|nr:hypothetical protein Pan216_25430 [Planctomycetes bacterium Pan216]